MTAATPPDSDVIAPRAGEELDAAAVARVVGGKMPGADGVPQIWQFPGGHANLTYLLQYSTAAYVLRRGPHGDVAAGAHDMGREYRVLSTLYRQFPLAPRAFVYCEDKSVIGAAFFVMERRRGEVVRTTIPEAMRHHADAGRRMGLALVDAMADLHALDAAACGLGDLGRPEGFVDRQLSGWATRWELSKFDDSPAEMQAIHARLAGDVPRPSRVSIVHNDLKLDNCQFDPANPDRVTSIFDWDMTTLGDPLIDLGTLLNYWPDPADPPHAQRFNNAAVAGLGLPPRAALIARYAERTGADLASVRWWEAFALWKTVVVVQQLHRRWVRGESKDPRMATVADRIPSLIAAATAVLEDV